MQDSTGGVTAFDLNTKVAIWSTGDTSAALHLRTQAKPVVVGF